MIKLKNYSTKPPKDADKATIKAATKRYAKRIGELKNLLVAEGKHSLLVVFQGMDASGKDGAVKNTFEYCTHNNISVHSFKKPTEEEMRHDFLWRVHQQAPGKGEIKIFNRSHYEEVLIQRVHGWITDKQVDLRFDSINAFEKTLQYDANTIILKFYLHLSYDQQAIELQERIDEHDKHYKHNPGDWEERKHWKKYMAAYEDVLNRSAIPWVITPVDNRWYRDYIVSKTVCEALEALDMKWPSLEA
ncbi:MAG: PPK2 family polyphosphate kinase [Bacteroidota bacterium]